MRGSIGRESGAATLWIVITFSLLLIALAFTYSQRVARAEDEGATLQLAADAAALAGAQSVVADAPALVEAMLNNGGVPLGVTGQPAAAEFAGRNGASVIEYSYASATGRIKVRVRSNKPLVDGRFAETTSHAVTGVGLLACTLPARPSVPSLTPASRVAPATVAPEPTGTAEPRASAPTEPSALATPPLQETYSGTARCGELTLPVTVNVTTGVVTVPITDQEIRAMFRPRLAG